MPRWQQTRITEETSTYAVGHLALGYMFAKLTSKATKNRANVALILTLSVIPDIDFLIPSIDQKAPPTRL